MRILCVTSSYPRGPGDLAGVFVRDLALALEAEGVRSEIVAPDHDGPVRSADRGPTLHRARYAWPRSRQRLFYGAGAPEHLERSLRAWLQAPAAVASLAATVARRAHAADLVLAHWLVPGGLAAILGAAASRRPVVVVAHSGDAHLLARLWGGAAVARFIHDRVRAIFAVCEETARILRALGAGAKTKVVRLGAPAPASASAPSRSAARARWGIAPGEALVAGLGRFEPVKGFDVLVDAMAELGLPARLVLAGDGSERSALRARAEARGVALCFGGVLEGAAKAELLRAADVVALPSRRLPSGRTEGTPVVLFEALAAGRPVAASAVGGIPEVLAAHGVGRLVPPDSPAALANALRELLTDRARHGLASRRAARHLGVDRVGPRWRAALEAAMGEAA